MCITFDCGKLTTNIILMKSISGGCGGGQGGGQGQGGFQTLNSEMGRIYLDCQNQNHGLEHRLEKGNSQGSCIGDQSKNVDGDPDAPPKEFIKIPLVSKGDHPIKWSSLFRIKPTGKSSFPPVKIRLQMEKGSCAIVIPDKIMDHKIKSMDSTLIGKFLGPRPNIDVVRTFIQKKWALKGHVLVTTMAKGFLSFEFTCMEYLSSILSEGQWDIGHSTLVLQKWSYKMNLNDSFFVQAPVWVRLPEMPLEFWNEDVFVGLAISFGEILSIDPIIASKR